MTLVCCQAADPGVSRREGSLLRLIEEVQECRRCPRMEGRTRVLSQANGPASARVLFVAEAPGRLGADHIGVPLVGDRTGRTFDQLLASAGLHRDHVFITNAVLCNPRDNSGRNARPTAREVANCGGHLARLIAIVQPLWVVTLGAVALEAIARVAPHAIVLARDVGRPAPWQGRWLVPLYHPGPRALIRRPLAVQHADYERLAALIASAPEPRDDAPFSQSASSL